ncbi:hypothetical protein NQ318_009391 [Aromia moschata]|uniref:Uncharacterized protein n=1 Tax=Aromia moschata TaxID=1265417 RepID=A0AAV8Z6S0_9CUCU|nr:hypothetical protein NQ318_009391 [Aromia moschata]
MEDLQQRIVKKIEEINGPWILQHVIGSVKIRTQMCINMGRQTYLFLPLERERDRERERGVGEREGVLDSSLGSSSHLGRQPSQCFKKDNDVA